MENQTRPLRHLPIIIVILAVTAVLIVALVRDRIVNPNYNNVTLIGRGTVIYQPDTAIITAAINDGVKGADAVALQTKIAARLDKILKALKELASIEADAYPSGFTLNPSVDVNVIQPEQSSVKPMVLLPLDAQFKTNTANNTAGNGSVVSLQAQQMITVRLSNIDKYDQPVERALAVLITEGANQILGTTYTKSDLNDVRRQAWLKAYDHISENIKEITSRTGIKFGELTNWYETLVNSGDISNVGAGVSYSPGGYYSNGPQLQGTFPREYTIEINAGYKIDKN